MRQANPVRDRRRQYTWKKYRGSPGDDPGGIPAWIPDPGREYSDSRWNPPALAGPEFGAAERLMT